MTLLVGRTIDVTITYDGGTASVSAAIPTMINGQAFKSVPIAQPYGLLSIPTVNTPCIYGSVGQNFNQIAVVGFPNSLPAQNNLIDMKPGETALWSSTQYTLKVKNDKLLSTFTNSAGVQIDTEIAIDKNMVRFIIDIIAEIKSLEAAYNNQVTINNQLINLYNSHTHTGVSTGASNTGPTVPSADTIPVYNGTPNFTADDEFLGTDGKKTFIDDNGELIT
jgi:phage gp45-like